MITFKKVYSDGMILQRDTENTIRGNSQPGSIIELALSTDGKVVFSASSTADRNGLWAVTLPPVKGSYDSYSITASCGDEKAIINNFCFGEVFHISGQSNMELPMSRTYDPFYNEVIEADYPFIREFRAEIANCFDPAAASDDFAGGCWKKATGDDVLNMSAAGFYFAEDIHRRLDMPVGLVNTSAGGAAVESFMPYDMIKSYGIHDEFLAKATEPDYISRTSAEDAERERAWTEALGNEDFGMAPSDDMKSCFVPCHTSELEGLENGFSGRIWFFRKFNVPDDFPINGSQLLLGTIIDSDCAFINGIRTGETGYMYPPRYYHVADGALKKGENIIAVRMDIKGGQGGFTKGKRYCIKSGNRTIELAGEWKYAIAAECDRLTPGVFFQGLPLALYSCMTTPVLPLKFKAMLWYQGETNCGRADLYRKMFGDYVDYFRKNCGYEIPVISTQLCNFSNPGDTTSSWAKFRLAQLDCLDIPKTAMAVTIDIGESNDLHPTNKAEVGKRLAYCAGGLLYGDDTIFVRCTKAQYLSDGEIRLTFSDGVHLDDVNNADFEAVYGYMTAKCTVRQTKLNELTLKTTHFGCPMSIRYAFRNDPAAPFLKDMRMKPVSPFSIAVETEFKKTASLPALKDAYAGKFNIGIATSSFFLRKKEFADIVKAQYNSFTCENSMKPEGIIDGEKCKADPEKYMHSPAVHFDGIRAELDFARENGMTVRGHTLVWHNQTPAWFFYKNYDENGEFADKELMLSRMENYIKSVMEWTEENYPGLISVWDVVNEAADDYGGMRNSLWRRTVGDEFIPKAFEFARKYAPKGVKLFYNDYNSYKPNKQKDILEFLKPVAEAGNLDGMGMQSHIDVMCDLSLYISAMEKYHKELGVEIHVTELDIEKIGNDNWEKEQGAFFGKYMTELLRAKKNGIPVTSVTLWGISDDVSWKYKYSPLIFNYDLSPKSGFEEMIRAAESID